MGAAVALRLVAALRAVVLAGVLTAVDFTALFRALLRTVDAPVFTGDFAALRADATAAPFPAALGRRVLRNGG